MPGGGIAAVESLGHLIPRAGNAPNGDKISTLTNIPMLHNVDKVRSLCGGLSYHRKYLPKLAKPLKSTRCLLKNIAVFEWTDDMSTLVCTLMNQLLKPPVLAFPDWDTALDGSRKFHLFCDASKDGLGATVEQEQCGGSIRPIALLSRVMLPNEQQVPSDRA